MKSKIHPEYKEIVVTCSCGNKLNVNSTRGKNLHIDVCSKCHPFYTGEQKIVDTTKRIDRFNKQYGMPSTTKEKKKTPSEKEKDK